jgi:hypothetical protein
MSLRPAKLLKTCFKNKMQIKDLGGEKKKEGEETRGLIFRQLSICPEPSSPDPLRGGME